MPNSKKRRFLNRLKAARLSLRAWRLWLGNRGMNRASLRDFDAGLLSRMAVRGDLNWPRRTGPWVCGRDVLDVGCGRNYQALGFLAVGARSYTGIDPTLDLQSDRVKDSRQAWSHFESGGLSPQALRARYAIVRFECALIEDYLERSELFDVVVMHNVTEHLMQLPETLARLPGLLRPGGMLVLRHPNFYCWHGHHLKPRTIREINSYDETQQHVMDWAHVQFDPGAHAWIGRTQNRVRLQELRSLLERDFVIESWEEVKSSPLEGADRLTPEILARYPDFSQDELLTKCAYIAARKRV